MLTDSNLINAGGVCPPGVIATLKYHLTKALVKSLERLECGKVHQQVDKLDHLGF